MKCFLFPLPQLSIFLTVTGLLGLARIAALGRFGSGAGLERWPADSRRGCDGEDDQNADPCGGVGDKSVVLVDGDDNFAEVTRPKRDIGAGDDGLAGH